MVEIMWFLRGFQSAVYYYVACSPCTDIKYRRKRKREAVQSRAERARLEQEQPHLIPQPLPGYTNDYWAEEVQLGPGPPVKRGHGPREPVCSRAGSRKGVGSSHQGSSARELSSGGADVNDPRTSENGARVRMIDSSNHQREDEFLWGGEYDVNRPGRRSGRQFHGREGSSVGLPGRGRADTNRSDGYYISHSPMVNEIYAPVVSLLPMKKHETKWMLQPPPRAKIMEGKEKVSIPSHGSVTRKGEGERRELGRHVLERMPSNLGNSTQAYPPEQSSAGQALGDAISFSPSHRRRKARPPAISITKDSPPSSSQSSQNFPSDLDSPLSLQSAKLLRRPPLATIKSSSDIIPHLRHRRDVEVVLATSPPLTSDSTLNSRSPSPFSSKLPHEEEPPDPNFSPPDSTKERADKLFYWAGSEINFSSGSLKRNDENGAASRRYETVGAASPFWRWSMDI